MIVDSHIHLGQFYDIYTTPMELKNFLRSVGVVKCAISSTTICEENYEKVIGEIRTFLSMFGETNVSPVLWVTPQMIKHNVLDLFLDSGIGWRCLKIHPQLHPKGWPAQGKNFRFMLDLSRKMRLPILIHTGAEASCNAEKYLKLIKRNTDIKFILAHGRPLSETVKVLRECPNAFVDTAFMSTDSIVEFCRQGYASRVLWGSDVPIPLYFYGGDKSFDMGAYYISLLSDLKSRVPFEDYELITSENYKSVFG